MSGVVDAFHIAGAGIKAQGDRLRVIAQNLANADSTGQTPGSLPYQRKTITFKNVLDKEMGVEVVKVARFGVDKSDFRKKYDPGHPAADAQGYVLYPNVEPVIEMVDMREAQRAYEANINVIEVSKAMVAQTLSMLK